MRQTRDLSGRFLLLAALGAAACSGTATVQSPTAPSPLATAPAAGLAAPSTAPDNTASGPSSVHRTAAVTDAAAVAAWATSEGWAMAAGLAIEGTDVVTAISGACPSIVLTVRGVPVTVNAATTFGSSTTCAGLVVGDTVRVRGQLFFDTGSYSVVATEVTRVTGSQPPGNSTPTGPGNTTPPGNGTPGGPGSGRRHRGEGTVSSLTGTCPTVTMNIRGVRVTTDASTTYEHGGCGNLRPGTKVEVEGDEQADGSLLATHIEIKDQPGRGGPDSVEGEGTVASLRGTCPELTMVVRGLSVMTTADTEFEGGVCSAIRNGMRVEVRGRYAGNAILADRVRIVAERTGV
ncbi:MAG: DUF5666 domain-containing protein [Acidobacteriota bacterium]